MIHVTKLIGGDVFQSIDIGRHQLLLCFHSITLNDVIKAYGWLPIDSPRRIVIEIDILSNLAATALPLIQRRATLSNDASNDTVRPFGHRQ